MGVGYEIPPIPTVFPGKNGRRHNRLRCISLAFKGGEILDVSASGAKIKVRGWMRSAVGDVIAFEIEGLDDKIISLQGRVVWISREGWRRHEMGVHFESVSDETKQELISIAKVTSRW